MNSRTIAADTTLAGLDRLGGYIGYHTERQAVIASNVANLDTPGFRARDLAFSEQVDLQLAGDVQTQSVTHTTEAVTSDDEVPDEDGNTVSLEGQMAKMNANLVRYKSISELLSRRLGMLRYAVTDSNG
jgi:flagellar basal-body rod protein FlgB